jgi:Xaa-Pro aminopeptidase
MSLEAHFAAIDALALHAPFRNAHLAACRSITENNEKSGTTQRQYRRYYFERCTCVFPTLWHRSHEGPGCARHGNLGEVWVGYDGEPNSTQFG